MHADSADPIRTPRAEHMDEMVDGKGGLRPHWRSLFAACIALEDGGIAERGHRLDRAFEDEGVTGVLPGMATQPTPWRCDPMPLPIPSAEFRALEAGLAQRARLLEAVLQDLYGPQNLLADGVLPPAMVYANPAFLRPCHVIEGVRRESLLQLYAADLVRGPDGAWRVLADRTAAPAGMSYARENRRILARVLPELFRPVQIRPLRPFFDMWQDALRRLAPPERANPAIALLTPGTGHPQWFEHMHLARELSCVLAEGSDLTVRGGAVYLKTLRGLQPIDVVLRRIEGRLVDPLELDLGGGVGVTGLMDAVRRGRVRIVNDPGSGALEAPALAAFLPELARRLLGETLRLASVPTLWLGHAAARSRVLADTAAWLIRPATDGLSPAILTEGLDPPERLSLLQRIEARPWDYAASAWTPPSVAPCCTEAGLAPRPIVLRVFLVFDGCEWRAMPGGLARVLGEGDRIAGRLPWQGLSKDVWVLSEEGGDILGPAASVAPRLPIRRTAGELPSRVADTLFWLGRYVERLEDSARLARAALRRLGRGTTTPRDVAELQALSRCLKRAGLIEAEDATGAAVARALSDALLRSVRDGGRILHQLSRVAQLTEAARDRLTDDMYTTFTQALRVLRAEAAGVDGSLDTLSQLLLGVLRFCAGVAGLAAENMVRAGGWLFLDLGRRIERAQSTSAAIAAALDQQPERIEAGLRLVLELCDSTITYRNRYLTVLQPGPVLDLVLADPGNPRSLAFQLAAMRTRLDEVAGPSDRLAATAAGLSGEVEALVQRVIDSPEQAVEAANLPPRLRAVAAGVAALSDRIDRRYFALLPAPQAVGVNEVADETIRGAA